MDKDKYIGRLLDNRYEILEVIGTGGMAVVYKARCHRLNRLVAIKILKDDNLEDEDFRRRFHAESQAVAMLSHPNIVNVYDVSTSVMADYIVMELIEGITLKQYMAKKGVLNWKETLHFAMQIAKALEHAHSKGIVHRDIKPHNVMVLKNGSVKVMDFGIARLISRGNTLTKEALGSVHYISPEQARGGRIDDRSDIYSLGVVMYEMMAGRPPYDGESPVAVAIQHINGGAALPSVLNPNIPGGLEQIIMKAMARNLSDRYPSATRMLADMEEFRKDPTILFDYTGLPLDAALRVQKPLIPNGKEQTDGKGMPELNPRSGENKPPVTPPPTITPPPQREPRKPGPQARRTGQTGAKAAPQSGQNKPPRQPRQPRSEKEEFMMSRSTTTAIIVCSVVVVIAIAILMGVMFGGKGNNSAKSMVEVPNFEGMKYSELPKKSNLSIIADEVYDDFVPEGNIISQKPEAGEKVKKNSRVTVVVSLGPRPTDIAMPELEHKTREEAEKELLKYGLQATVIEEYNDEFDANTVVRTTPAKGTKLTKDTKITIVISKGQKMQFGSMPNVIGLTQAQAEATLNQQGLDLKFEVKDSYDLTQPVGVVTKTDPGRTEKLYSNDTVIIWVNKGIEKKNMPSVLGMNVDEAKALLQEQGFYKEAKIVYVASKEAKGIVLGQNPESNAPCQTDAEITLSVSDGSLVPAVVKKDVVIDLRGHGQHGAMVTVKRDSVVVFMLSVPKGTTSVTLQNQEGAGTVYYTVMVDDSATWVHTEVFSVEGAPTPNE